jgi:hypothetical protein
VGKEVQELKEARLRIGPKVRVVTASNQIRGLARGERGARAQRGSTKDWSKGRLLCAPKVMISRRDLTMKEANGCC